VNPGEGNQGREFPSENKNKKNKAIKLGWGWGECGEKTHGMIVPDERNNRGVGGGKCREGRGRWGRHDGKVKGKGVRESGEVGGGVGGMSSGVE